MLLFRDDNTVGYTEADRALLNAAAEALLARAGSDDEESVKSVCDAVSDAWVDGENTVQGLVDRARRYLGERGA